MPDKGEREQIIDYARRESSKFRQATHNIEAQIEKLEELRKITINDAVTGKVKVTD